MPGNVPGAGKELWIDVDVVIDRLLAVISGQTLQIAKLEALNTGLMKEIDALKGQVEQG